MKLTGVLMAFAIIAQLSYVHAWLLGAQKQSASEFFHTYFCSNEETVAKIQMLPTLYRVLSAIKCGIREEFGKFSLEKLKALVDKFKSIAEKKLQVSGIQGELSTKQWLAIVDPVNNGTVKNILENEKFGEIDYFKLLGSYIYGLIKDENPGVDKIDYSLFHAFYKTNLKVSENFVEAAFKKITEADNLNGDFTFNQFIAWGKMATLVKMITLIDANQ